jgi:hypothetical protein
MSETNEPLPTRPTDLPDREPRIGIVRPLAPQLAATIAARMRRYLADSGDRPALPMRWDDRFTGRL